MTRIWPTRLVIIVLEFYLPITEVCLPVGKAVLCWCPTRLSLLPLGRPCPCASSTDSCARIFLCYPFLFSSWGDEVGRSLWLRGNHVNLPPRQREEMSGPGEENGSGRHNNLAANPLCQMPRSARASIQGPSWPARSICILQASMER